MAMTLEQQRALARARARSRLTTQTAPQVGVGEDMAKGFGRGALEGAAGLVGMVGDAGSLMDNLVSGGADWLRNKIAGPRSPEDQANIDTMRTGRPQLIPTTEQVTGAVDTATGNQFQYDPQTRAGKFARTVGQFVPAAATMGIPGGVRGVASSAIKYGAVPGVVSEAAGQTPGIEGTPFEPYARVGGALLAGGAMAGLERTAGARAAKRAAPSTDVLKARSKALYDQAGSIGLVIENSAFDDLVQNIGGVVRGPGHTVSARARLSPKTFAVMRDLEKSRAIAPTLDDIDEFRQVLGKISREVGPNTLPTTDAALASQVIDKIDDFMDGLTSTSVIAGDPRQATTLIGKAREAWRTRLKGETVDGVFYRAKNRVGANYSAAGMQTALRQEFKTIANNPTKMRMFNAEERTAILAVVRGGPIENFLRRIGKLAPAGYLSMVLSPSAGASLGTGLLGPGLGTAVGAVAVPAVGAGAKIASTMIGKGKANFVDALVRGGQKGRQIVSAAEDARRRALAAALVNSTLPLRQP